MMTMLATLQRIPELNVGFHFYMKSDELDQSDSEKFKLQPTDKKITSYTKNAKEDEISYQLSTDDQSHLVTKE